MNLIDTQTLTQTQTQPSDDYYQLNILKKKYFLLEQFDLIKLPFLLDDMFELGYNTWIKNQLKCEFQNNFNNNVQQMQTLIPSAYGSTFNSIPTPISTIPPISTNILTESKNSNLKGMVGENIVMDIIIDRFPNLQITNTSKIPHGGDIQIILSSGNKVIFEVKNYNRTIEQEQIDKLKFDMKFNNIYGAVFISLNSGIVGKKRFEIETFRYDAKNYFILFVPYSMHKMIPNKKNIINHNSMEDSILNLTIRIEFSLCTIENIIDKFNASNNFDFDVNACHTDTHANTNTDVKINLNLEYLTQNLNIIYDEFKLVKNSSIKMEENIKKSLNSHLSNIKEFETFIINKINYFIEKKIIKNYKKKFIIESNFNTDNSWSIILDNHLYGMIININNKYDLLLECRDIKTNKQFNNFSDCVDWINWINHN